MATKEEVRRILNSHRGELSQLGVERLSLFGSVARGDDKPESDVDVLVEFSSEAKKHGYFRKFMRLALRLEEILGRKVDLATPAMVRRIRANLDEVPIFA